MPAPGIPRVMTSDETSHNKFYAGPDLHNAAARSRLQLEAFGRARGMRDAAAVVAGLTADRLRRRDSPHLEFIVARGESAGQDPLSVAYAGSGANREWCLSRVLANYEVTKRQT